MKATYEDIKSRLVHHGRKESDCRVLFTFNPMVMGPTEEEVRRKEQLFEDVGQGMLEAGFRKYRDRSVSTYPNSISTSRSRTSIRICCRAAAA